MALHGVDYRRAVNVVDAPVLEQVNNFQYLDYSVSYIIRNDVVNKVVKINYM